MPRDRSPSLEFEAHAVDQLEALVGAWRRELKLSDAEIAWGLAILQAYTEVPAITNAAQYRAYRRRLSETRTAASAHCGGDARAMMFTRDGPAVLALAARIDEYQKSRSARRHALRRRIKDLAVGAAGEIWRVLKGRD